MAAPVSVPSFHDSRSYGSAPTQGRGNVPDPRYASPDAVNSYSPPDQQALYFSQPQPLSGPQFPAYAPLPAPGYGQEPYSSDSYPAHLASVCEYPPGGSGVAPQLTQAAPRQRVSVACDSCRKRKIKCSDTNSDCRAQCKNCVRLNQECTFKPAASSTAFVPVSAISGGVPSFSVHTVNPWPQEHKPNPNQPIRKVDSSLPDRLTERFGAP